MRAEHRPRGPHRRTGFDCFVPDGFSLIAHAFVTPSPLTNIRLTVAPTDTTPTGFGPRWNAHVFHLSDFSTSPDVPFACLLVRIGPSFRWLVSVLRHVFSTICLDAEHRVRVRRGIAPFPSRFIRTFRRFFCRQLKCVFWIRVIAPFSQSLHSHTLRRLFATTVRISAPVSSGSNNPTVTRGCLGAR